jgi:hypothetical protein
LAQTSILKWNGFSLNVLPAWKFRLSDAEPAKPMPAIVKIVCDEIERLEPVGRFMEGWASEDIVQIDAQRGGNHLGQNIVLQ